ncbi:MAG: hypothetical protein QM831_27210 [Kofleriaceae bacterium]
MKAAIVMMLLARVVIAAPHVEWEVHEVEDNRVGLAALKWFENDKAYVWSIKPPGRFARLSMCCWGSDPRGNAAGLEWLDPLVLDKVLVLQGEQQLWVLDRATGKVVFDWSDNRTNLQSGMGSIRIDIGTVEVTVAGKTCTSKVKDQNFAVACGDFVVYLDAGYLGLFATNPWKEVAMKLLPDEKITCESHDVKQTFHVDKATVTLRGQRIVQCLH